MKGLKIKGKIYVGEVNYEVLYSQLVKDFAKLPANTKMKVILQLIEQGFNSNNTDVTEKDYINLLREMNVVIEHLKAVIPKE